MANLMDLYTSMNSINNKRLPPMSKVGLGS
jgi:hypothetical protein